MYLSSKIVSAGTWTKEPFTKKIPSSIAYAEPNPIGFATAPLPVDELIVALTTVPDVVEITSASEKTDVVVLVPELTYSR